MRKYISSAFNILKEAQMCYISDNNIPLFFTLDICVLVAIPILDQKQISKLYFSFCPIKFTLLKATFFFYKLKDLRFSSTNICLPQFLPNMQPKVAQILLVIIKIHV